MKLKLALGVLFHKRSWSLILSNWSCGFFYKRSGLKIKHCPLTKFIFSKLKLYSLCGDCHSHKIAHQKVFPGKVMWPHYDVFFRPHLWSGILNVSFQLMTDNKLVKSMYERIIASCANADESYFKWRDVEISWS